MARTFKQFALDVAFSAAAAWDGPPMVVMVITEKEGEDGQGEVGFALVSPQGSASLIQRSLIMHHLQEIRKLLQLDTTSTGMRSGTMEVDTEKMHVRVRETKQGDLS